MFWHMPDNDSVAPSAEWGWGKGTEIADYHYVRLTGTECGLFIGTDRAYAGSRHDGGSCRKCRFCLCAIVLLLVYLYLLLYYSPHKAFQGSWGGQFFHPARGLF